MSSLACKIEKTLSDMPAWQRAALFASGLLSFIVPPIRWLMTEHVEHGWTDTAAEAGGTIGIMFLGLFLMIPRAGLYLLDRIPLPLKWRRDA